MFAWLDLSFICEFLNKPLSTVTFSFPCSIHHKWSKACTGSSRLVIEEENLSMDEHSGKPPRHVIITGGAGFIGSQISDRFLKEKTRVTILTRNVSTSIEAQGLGSESEIPLREDMACRPVSDYGRSKGQAEHIMIAWGSLSGHRALVFRAGSFLPHGMALVYWMDARTGCSPFDLCDMRSTT